MSLFKKPSKKFRHRVTRVESEEDDEGADVGDVKEKVNKGDFKDGSSVTSDVKEKLSGVAGFQSISKDGVVKEKDEKTDAQTNKSTTKLLSFHDEEEDSEVFKLKKSNYSRRLARQLEKERKKRQEISNLEVSVVSVVEAAADSKQDTVKESEKENSKLVKSESDTIVSGKEAEDMDVDSGDDDAALENPFKDVLQSGIIPDAATIYAMKKHRQMAREMGDFIPIEETEKDDESKSRLIRDDDNDRSDDDDDDEPSRLSFTVNTGAVERQKVREAFLSIQTDHEADLENEEAAELERWEREQIRKGVSVAQVAQPQSQQFSESQFYSYPSAVEDQQLYPPIVQNKDSNSVMVPKAIVVPDNSSLTTNVVKARLEERLSSLKNLHKSHQQDLENCQKELVDANNLIQQLEKEAPELEKSFSLYQEMRGYVKDLVECLDLKVAHIEVLDTNLMELYKSRSQNLISRRQQDIRDQSDEFSALSSKVLRGSGSEIADKNNCKDEQRLRRAAEREGRRMRRRKQRENSLMPSKHHEGMSSDDEEPDIDVMKFKEKKEGILEEASIVFEDVVDEFGTILGVMTSFEKWKTEQPGSYSEAFVPLCLPKIFGPFVRLELIKWNPLEEYTDLETMSWFKALTFYGFNESADEAVEDPDINLLPGIMEKVILPKITEFVQNVWDPMSSKETLNLVNLIKKMCEDYPTITGKSKQVQKLLQAVTNRILKSLDEDVFIPLCPKELLENRSLGSSVFFQRQFWSSVKLLNNILSWNGIIAEQPLQDMALASLLNRYLLMGLHTSITMRDTLDKCKAIVASFPKNWFSDLKVSHTIPLLMQFSQFLVKFAHTFQSQGTKRSPKDEDNIENVKEIIHLLITIGSLDDAVAMAKKFSITGLRS